MPSNIPVAPKSQYEIERDERIKRNEAFMLSIGIDPHGGGYMKQNKKKAPPKPRLPRPKVPESERRRSSRLQGGTAEPERLTYDEWSDDERPRQRSRGSGGRRARKNRLVELSEEQRAALEDFDMDDFEAWMEPDGEHPISDDNRRQVIRQVTKLVSGEGVHYDSVNFGWPDDVIFRKDEPVTMQSDAVPNQFRASRHRRDVPVTHSLISTRVGAVVAAVRVLELSRVLDDLADIRPVQIVALMA